MGFSVSGSMAVILIGVLVAFGVMFPAVLGSSQQLGDAQAAQGDRILEQQNTDIAINETTYDAGEETFNVTVDNAGTTDLDVETTDVLVDGTYRVPERTAVGGDGETGVWLPGETLRITVGNVSSQPGSVKVVTETGVADRTEVSA